MQTSVLAASLALGAALALAAGPEAARAAVQDPAAAAKQAGLQAASSRTLDEVYLRSGGAWAAYRKVAIDPVDVALRKNWLKDLNASRGPSRWLSQGDADELVKTATESMARMVAAEFAAKGYEIVATPGPGVLRVTPSVTDLDVYEPDATFARPSRLYTHDTAGTATLQLEARDGGTGALVGVFVDRGTATQVSRFNRATQTSNVFWFDAMFRQWTDNCIAELQAAPAP